MLAECLETLVILGGVDFPASEPMGKYVFGSWGLRARRCGRAIGVDDRPDDDDDHDDEREHHRKHPPPGARAVMSVVHVLPSDLGSGLIDRASAESNPRRQSVS